jgi:thiol-disulfide isomerase/thioredoxin
MTMATLKERFNQWNQTRSLWQKAGDVIFWLLLVMLIIPGPRKAISTAVNRVALLIKSPGMIAPDRQVELDNDDLAWRIRTGSGAIISLQDLEGKPVFLNFWASWCPPCVAELPEIARAYEKHGEEVAFLLVTDQEPGVVEAFMEKHGYEFPVAYVLSALPGPLDHGSIPTTFIISPEGKIVVQKTGAANWDSGSTDRIFEQLLR